MNKASTKFTSKAIDVNVLDVLDVSKDGKVVTAEHWKQLWSLVFNSVNNIDAYCVNIETLVLDWQASEAELQNIIAELQTKYEALSDSFVHYGEEAPTNEHVRFWVKPNNGQSAPHYITEADMIDYFYKTTVGRKTPEGGEIFNDYENNKAYGKTAAAFGSGSVAGSKYFEIVEIDKEKFLEPNPVENTPVGSNILPKYITVIVSAPLDQLQDKHSGAVISLGNGEKHFDCVGGLLVRDAETSNWSEGKITFSIDAPGLSLQEDFNPDTDMPTMLWFPDYPEFGTHTMESASFAGGDGCESIGENSVSFNTDNKSIGKHSATFGKGNLAAFAAMAINFMNKALGRSSFVTGVLNKTTADAEGAFVGGNSSTAKHPFSFVFGKFLSTAARFQAVFGFFNQPNESALFQVGNGIHDNEGKRWEPRTAFEVLESGSARVQTQGETADSVAQVQFVESKSRDAVTNANKYTDSVKASLSKDISAVNSSMNAQTNILFNAVNLTSANTPLVQKLNKHATMLAEISANISGNGDTFATIAEITLEEAVNTITIDESTFSDISKVKDFYIAFDVAKPEVLQAGSLYIKASVQGTASIPMLAVINTWNNASYVLNGNFYSKCFDDYFRFNTCPAALAANGLTNYNLTTTIAQTNKPLKSIIIQCATSTSLIPVGSKIIIKGYVSK